jgi:hypothetical protein
MIYDKPAYTAGFVFLHLFCKTTGSPAHLAPHVIHEPGDGDLCQRHQLAHSRERARSGA